MQIINLFISIIFFSILTYFCYLILKKKTINFISKNDLFFLLIFFMFFSVNFFISELKYLIIIFYMFLFFLSLYIFTHKNLKKDYYINNIIQFTFLCVLIIIFVLLIESILDLFLDNKNYLLKIIFVYLLSSVLLSYLLKNYINLDIIDFNMIMFSTSLTLIIHIILIFSFQNIQIIFFRIFGLILDAYLLVIINNFYEFNFSVTTRFFKISKNIVEDNTEIFNIVADPKPDPKLLPSDPKLLPSDPKLLPSDPKLLPLMKLKVFNEKNITKNKKKIKNLELPKKENLKNPLKKINVIKNIKK